MTEQQKWALFNDYFMLELETNINVSAFTENEAPPSLELLSMEMPYPFKLASEISMVDSQAIQPLRHLGSQADDLVRFLNAQSRKIDLMMSYILSKEDDDMVRFQTEKFGAGGLTFTTTDTFTKGEQVRLKIFLGAEAAAVYCFGEILQVDTTEDGFLVTLLYSVIREEDRDLLVRCTLHQQSKQLKALKEKRQQAD